MSDFAEADLAASSSIGRLYAADPNAFDLAVIHTASQLHIHLAAFCLDVECATSSSDMIVSSAIDSPIVRAFVVGGWLEGRLRWRACDEQETIDVCAQLQDPIGCATALELLAARLSTAPVDTALLTRPNVVRLGLQVLSVEGTVSLNHDMARRAWTRLLRDPMLSLFASGALARPEVVGANATYTERLLRLSALLRIDESHEFDVGAGEDVAWFALAIHPAIDPRPAASVLRTALRRRPLMVVEAAHAPQGLCALCRSVERRPDCAAQVRSLLDAIVHRVGVSLVVALARNGDMDVLRRVYAACGTEAREELVRTWPTRLETELGVPPLPPRAHDVRGECPITMQPFTDPVRASDGHAYERHQILLHLMTSSRSPLTRNPISTHVISLCH
tara:strand:- start:249 stop:1421 length:1173 start_codon:yes stop_codon:yes gene_type:complete